MKFGTGYTGSFTSTRTLPLPSIIRYLAMISSGRVIGPLEILS